MDSTVIQEIANQLGMAVDQAGQFITEHLPEFAGLKVVQIATPFCIAGALFVVSAMTAIISFIVARKTLKERKEAWDDTPYDGRRFYDYHMALKAVS